MLRLLIFVLFMAIIASLFSGLYYLLKDQSRSQRTVWSLTIRVGLALVLILLLILGFYTGELQLRTPFPVSGG